MVRYPGKHFDRVSVKVESIIAELVDNSIAAGAENIQVILMKDVDSADTCKRVSTEPQIDMFRSFSVTVMDDGDGFESLKEFHNSFELGEMPDNEKDRKPGESGLFFVGMKESTLNKFHHFTLLTNHEGNVCSRSIRFPGNESEWLYEHLPYPEIGNNPSNELPAHLLTHTWFQNQITDPTWSTLAHASIVRKSLIEGDLAEDFDVAMENFQESLKRFLGVVYRDDLLQNKYSLKISRHAIEGDDKEIDVIPVDLFCENLTPAKIVEYIDRDTTELAENEKYIARTISGFGTLQGPRFPIHFEYLGGVVEAFLTPFLLPRANVKKLLSDTLGDVINGEYVLKSSDSDYSKMWKAENIQGFSFIREGRTIVIGNHDKADNYGFYAADEYNWSMNDAKTRVRFKVEYDIGEHNDAAFHLFMNKNGYIGIADRFFEMAMEKLAEVSIDGVARNMAKPHNVNRPFFKKIAKRHYYYSFGSGEAKKFAKDNIAICGIAGCNALHYGDTPQIRAKNCPKRPCKSCGRSLYSFDCTASTCHEVCGTPGCPTGVGHKSENCPSLKCQECENLENDCICCAACNTPTSDGICLTCPCDECGESFDSNGDCACLPPPPPEPEGFPEEEDEFGLRYSIDYYPSDKQNSLQAISKIMEDAELGAGDLIFD